MDQETYPRDNQRHDRTERVDEHSSRYVERADSHPLPPGDSDAALLSRQANQAQIEPRCYQKRAKHCRRGNPASDLLRHPAAGEQDEKRTQGWKGE